MPRYGADHRAFLESMGYFRPDITSLVLPREAWDWQESDLAVPIRLTGAIIGLVGGLLLSTLIVIIVLGIWGVIPL